MGGIEKESIGYEVIMTHDNHVVVAQTNTRTGYVFGRIELDSQKEFERFLFRVNIASKIFEGEANEG